MPPSDVSTAGSSAGRALRPLLLAAIALFAWGSLAAASCSASVRVSGAAPPARALARHAAQRRESAARASVIGGENAKPGSFPSLAYIVDFQGEEAVFACTGTVVAPNLVLTAGHCAVDEETGEIQDPSGFRVVTGNVNWASSEREISDVSTVAVYPDYTIGGPLDGWGDAALLELASPTSSPAVKLAGSEVWKPGTGAIIVGWGKTYPSQERPTERLRWASTVVQSGDWCRANAGAYRRGQICTIDAPSFKSGTCFGDSGGPLLAHEPGVGELVEIGIAHSVFGECATTRPDVFTRADLVASWVNAKIGELSPSSQPPPTGAEPASLPAMTAAEAVNLVRQGLVEDFGASFRRHRSYRIGCRRIESTRARCKVSWFHAPNDYYGSITVYYVHENAEVLWNDRYTIRWVNDRCYFHSGHRQRCTVHIRRR